MYLRIISQSCISGELNESCSSQDFQEQVSDQPEVRTIKCSRVTKFMKDVSNNNQIKKPISKGENMKDWKSNNSDFTAQTKVGTDDIRSKLEVPRFLNSKTPTIPKLSHKTSIRICPDPKTLPKENTENHQEAQSNPTEIRRKIGPCDSPSNKLNPHKGDCEVKLNLGKTWTLTNTTNFHLNGSDKSIDQSHHDFDEDWENGLEEIRNIDSDIDIEELLQKDTGFQEYIEARKQTEVSRPGNPLQFLSKKVKS